MQPGSSYEPDFLVRLKNDLTLLLEIKGYEIHNPDRINQKHTAARRWVSAVNNWGELGSWYFFVCRQLNVLEASIDAFGNLNLAGAAVADTMSDNR